MSVYEMYSKYYDQLNNQYELWYEFIGKNIPGGKEKMSMIEFGCGTGNILYHYKDSFDITGVDLSGEMLSQAREKMPGGKFVLADMTEYKSEEKYQTVLCLFDSLNHVLDISGWERFFMNVKNILVPDGVFLLDINTTQRLEKIVCFPPMFREFDGNYFIMKLNQKSRTNFLFDVRVLKNKGDHIFVQEQETIEETTCNGKEAYSMLKKCFSLVKAYNQKMEKMEPAQFKENESQRWFFVCRK